MVVKVCDALPGRGKTSACINMMNSNQNRRYVFVTQYLSEVDRIKKSCACRNFVSPEYNVNTGLTKLSDMQSLIQRGENIATTHALFLSYTEETKKMLRDFEYTLVLDEVVDVFLESGLCQDDIEILRRSGVVQESDEDATVMEWKFDGYGSEGEGVFREEMYRAKSKNFLKYDDKCFFWAIPPDLFTCFKEVYVLTYMFYGQSLKCFFDMYGVQYELIGVKKDNDVYQFCPPEEYKRAIDLRNLVHIYEGASLNRIGNCRTALSFSWYKTAADEEGVPDLQKLKNNLNNVLRNTWHAKSRDIMWTTFKFVMPHLRGKGYWNEYVTYNKRASNEFASRHYLAYCVNNFPRPMENRYFYDHGAKMNYDLYALSILVQWVFRSALRNGEEVWLYVPSQRMRTLFKMWLNKLAEGKDLELDHIRVDENDLRVLNKKLRRMMK